MTFIKMIRSDIFDELIKTPYAFVLLAIIARRAKRKNVYNKHNLKIGEALIGDYKNYGMSEQKYRTAKDQLTKHNFITINTTNKGTVATIINTDVFDINVDDSNEPDNDTVTDGITNEQRTGNEPATTKKNIKNIKKTKNVKNDKNKITDFVFFEDDKFKDTWNDYLEMRIKKRKPATARAELIALNKLKELSMGKVARAIDILEASILNSWQGIFPIEDKSNESNIIDQGKNEYLKTLKHEN